MIGSGEMNMNEQQFNVEPHPEFKAIVYDPIAAQSPDPKVRYGAQLEKMKMLGFENEQENIEALIKNNGDCGEAIDMIVIKIVESG